MIHRPFAGASIGFVSAAARDPRGPGRGLEIRTHDRPLTRAFVLALARRADGDAVTGDDEGIDAEGVGPFERPELERPIQVGPEVVGIVRHLAAEQELDHAVRSVHTGCFLHTPERAAGGLVRLPLSSSPGCFDLLGDDVRGRPTVPAEEFDLIESSDHVRSSRNDVGLNHCSWSISEKVEFFLDHRVPSSTLVAAHFRARFVLCIAYFRDFVKMVLRYCQGLGLVLQLHHSYYFLNTAVFDVLYVHFDQDIR